MEELNANGNCKECRKNKYYKKLCTQAKQRRLSLIDRAIKQTPAGRIMTYIENELQLY